MPKSILRIVRIIIGCRTLFHLVTPILSLRVLSTDRDRATHQPHYSGAALLHSALADQHDNRQVWRLLQGGGGSVVRETGGGLQRGGLGAGTAPQFGRAGTLHLPPYQH